MKLFKKIKTQKKVISIIILLLLILFLALNVINYLNIQPVQVEPEKLSNIFKIGDYEGQGEFGPTSLYKNGLITNDKLKIEKANNGIKETLYLDAFDKKTNKLEYTATRITKYFYKPNHKNKLYRTSESYINDNIVSSSYGYAINNNILFSNSPNKLKFYLKGTWHIEKIGYHSIDLNIERKNDTINSEFQNHTLLHKLILSNSLKQI